MNWGPLLDKMPLHLCSSIFKISFMQSFSSALLDEVAQLWDLVMRKQVLGELREGIWSQLGVEY